jgi:hypothetical protein
MLLVYNKINPLNTHLKTKRPEKSNICGYCGARERNRPMSTEKSIISLPEHIDELFSEMDSQIVVALQESDKGYAALAHERDEVTINFPQIEQWLEGSGALALSAEEHAGLARYTTLTAKTEDMERRAIYYAGHKDCIAWLKRIGAI